MRVSVNKEVLRRYEDRLNGALKLLGNIVVTDVQQRIRKNDSVVTGNLLNSISSVLNEADNEISIGTNVVYAPRVEFGFVGTDSLGRTFNQQPKSYLRITLKENEEKYHKLLAYMVKKNG